METTTQTHDEALREIGFEILSSPPRGGVDDENWTHIAYSVTLSLNGKAFWSGPYKLGIGHVNIPKGEPSIALHLSTDQVSMLYAIQRHPGADFKDKALQASLCAKLAIAQKVTPKLSDVLHSLILGASPVLNGETFQDWCANCGYSDDSIKAKAVYDTCVQTGLALKRELGQKQIEKIKDILQDH